MFLVLVFLKCPKFKYSFTHKRVISKQNLKAMGIKAVNFFKLAHPCVCQNQSGGLCHTLCRMQAYWLFSLGNCLQLEAIQRKVVDNHGYPFFLPYREI